MGENEQRVIPPRASSATSLAVFTQNAIYQNIPEFLRLFLLGPMRKFLQPNPLLSARRRQGIEFFWGQLGSHNMIIPTFEKIDW